MTRKMASLVMAIVLAAALLAGCVKVTGATASVTQIALTEGETAQIELTYTVDKEDATEKEIEKAVAALKMTYESSDENVVTVDKNGLVTAVAEGNTVITVHVMDGVDIVLRAIVHPQLTGLKPVLGSIRCVLNKPYLASVSVLPEPQDAVVGELKFTSADPGIAVVSDTGDITPAKVGETVVTIESSNGIKVDIPVTVVIEASEIIATPETMYLYVGSTAQIGVEVRPEGHEEFPLVYTSDNIGIATVTDTGVVKGLLAGTCTIAVTSGGNSVWLADTIKVVVSNRPAATTTATGSTGGTAAAAASGGTAAASGGAAAAPAATTPAEDPLRPTPENTSPGGTFDPNAGFAMDSYFD